MIRKMLAAALLASAFAIPPLAADGAKQGLLFVEFPVEATPSLFEVLHQTRVVVEIFQEDADGEPPQSAPTRD